MRTKARNVLPRGLTLMEVLIAMFVFLVGIIGALAVLPVGISNATRVIFQDAAIHLSSSKFAEFRRDNVNPLADLADGSGYMGLRQEPPNGNTGGWRDFAHVPGDTYEFFDDIERYEWRVDQDLLKPVGQGQDELGNVAPVEGGGGAALDLARVTIVIHLKGVKREHRFTQYIMNNN